MMMMKVVSIVAMIVIMQTKVVDCSNCVVVGSVGYGDVVMILAILVLVLMVVVVVNMMVANLAAGRRRRR